MTTSEIKFYPKRVLTQAQQQRVADHRASVSVGPDGTFNSAVRTIITPRGDLKEVTYKTIRPGFNERIMKPLDVPDLFEDLAHMNLILTNACNLSCSYCYEQHNKDYGRFTVESLKQLYDFLIQCNDKGGKLLLMHGTADPTVSFSEGMNFYNALRYNGKNAILLAYPGEGHGLRGLANRRDLTTRFFQYFDHYLRGAPAPKWMGEGVPFLAKDLMREPAAQQAGAALP